MNFIQNEVEVVTVLYFLYSKNSVFCIRFIAKLLQTERAYYFPAFLLNSGRSCMLLIAG